MQPLSTLKGAVARIAVVRSRFNWIDAGTWDAIGALWKQDADGNAVRGTALAIDSRNSVVYSPRRLVALVGVDGLAIVDAGEAILVCDRKRAQEVRRVVSTLRQRGWTRYL
jgi:mannose-1-phosphate guanylyltransferase